MFRFELLVKGLNCDLKMKHLYVWAAGKVHFVNFFLLAGQCYLVDPWHMDEGYGHVYESVTMLAGLYSENKVP